LKFEFNIVPLLVFEFLGTTELMVIALVALVIFGPRKLPDLGRTLGKHLGEFKRATEDFKRTWEREVEVDKLERELSVEELTRVNPPRPVVAGDTPDTESRILPPPLVEETVARTASATTPSHADDARDGRDEEAEATETTGAPAAAVAPPKHEWL
jgi:TatA/E family protein of Tat protein translocase